MIVEPVNLTSLRTVCSICVQNTHVAVYSEIQIQLLESIVMGESRFSALPTSSLVDASSTLKTTEKSTQFFTTIREKQSSIVSYWQKKDVPPDAHTLCCLLCRHRVQCRGIGQVYKAHSVAFTFFYSISNILNWFTGSLFYY